MWQMQHALRWFRKPCFPTWTLQNVCGQWRPAAFCTVPPRSPADRIRIGLLIDGDQSGPACWHPALRALSDKGTVVYKSVFAVPEMALKPKWTDGFNKYGIKFAAVPRTAGGGKDPNDMAIAMAAARLVSSGEVDAIALLVDDLDFLYVARQLRTFGAKTFLILREGAKFGLASAFEAEGAVVVRFADDDYHVSARQPKMQVVLHTNGESTVEQQQHRHGIPCHDHSLVANVLMKLDYLEHADNPIIPALAKFYFANSIGPLTIWPPKCLGEAREVIAKSNQQAFRANDWASVFVFPRCLARCTKQEVSTYGTSTCFSHVRLGGPFILADSTELVEVVLSRLGYLDDHLNTDVGDAIDVFAEAGMNSRNLRAIGLPDMKRFTIHTKRALLHGALISPRLHGHWQAAPRDTAVRQKLMASKKIPDVNAPANDVMRAIHACLKHDGVQPRHTYNGMVAQFLSIMNKSDPSRRR